MNNEEVKNLSIELVKSHWQAVSAILRDMSDEEFNKFPDIKDYPHEKICAEKYGITDIIFRSKDSQVTVYSISSCIFRGKIVTH